MPPFVFSDVSLDVSCKDRVTNIAQLPPPQKQGENCSKQQNDQAGYAMPIQIARVPAQEERHYVTRVLPPPNVAPRQESTIIVDDVMDINDFMGYNVFACLCCCWPLGLIGIIFSMLCDSAKSKGKRKQAEEFSALAKILFASSVFGGMILAIIVVILKRQHEF